MLFEQSKYDSDARLRLFSIGHTLDSGGLTYSFAFLRFTFIPIDRSYFMEIGSRQRRRFSKCSKFSVRDNVLFDGLRPSATDWVDSTFFPSAEKILGSSRRTDCDRNWFLDALNCMATCHNVSSRWTTVVYNGFVCSFRSFYLCSSSGANRFQVSHVDATVFDGNWTV